MTDQDDAIRAIAREVVGEGKDERSIIQRDRCESAIRRYIASRPPAPVPTGFPMAKGFSQAMQELRDEGAILEVDAPAPAAPVAMSEADRARLDEIDADDARGGVSISVANYDFLRRLLNESHAREADLQRRLDIAKDNAQAVLRMWENDDAAASQPRPQADDGAGVK